MDALVRHARPGDGEAMSDVFDQAGRAAWTHFLPADGLAELVTPSERWERDIVAEGADALVAECEGEVVAFAVVCPTQDPDGDPARTGELYEAGGWRLDGGRRRKNFTGVEFGELRYRIALGGR